MMGGGFGFGIPGLGMILFWGVIILVVVLLAGSLARTYGGGGDGSGRSQKSARDILDERYARGEIDREEYEEKKRSLR
jgi:putative membrane protein